MPKLYEPGEGRTTPDADDADDAAYSGVATASVLMFRLWRRAAACQVALSRVPDGLRESGELGHSDAALALDMVAAGLKIAAATLDTLTEICDALSEDGYRPDDSPRKGA